MEWCLGVWWPFEQYGRIRIEENKLVDSEFCVLGYRLLRGQQRLIARTGMHTDGALSQGVPASFLVPAAAQTSILFYLPAPTIRCPKRTPRSSRTINKVCDVTGPERLPQANEDTG